MGIGNQTSFFRRWMAIVLWIFFTLFYGIVVAVIAYIDAPSRNEITNKWAYAVIKCQARRISKEYNRDVSADDIIHKQGNRSVESLARELADGAISGEHIKIPGDEGEVQYRRAILDLETKYKAQLEKLPQEKLNHYLTYLKYWLIPSLVLLLFGHAVAWVIRRFRRVL